jgi:hypothetical protein
LSLCTTAHPLHTRFTRIFGSVALSLCTTAHPLHTRFANISGTCISEAVMRPNPKVRPLFAELDPGYHMGR